MSWCGVCQSAEHDFAGCNTPASVERREKLAGGKKRKTLAQKQEKQQRQWRCSLCRTDDHTPELHNQPIVSPFPVEPLFNVVCEEDSFYVFPTAELCRCEQFVDRMCYLCCQEQFDKLVENTKDQGDEEEIDWAALGQMEEEHIYTPSKELMDLQLDIEEARRTHRDPASRAGRAGVSNRYGDWRSDQQMLRSFIWEGGETWEPGE